MSGYPCRIFKTKDGRLLIQIPSRATQAIELTHITPPETIYLIPSGTQNELRFKKTL
jgi:hypothetical protein